MGVSKLIVVIGIVALVQSSYSAPSSKLCLCTREYLPICGTDDITYFNTCLFQCEKKRNANLEIKHHGKCDDKMKILPIEQGACACTEEYIPVCGTDEKTYINQCLLNCEKLKRAGLKLKHIGECSDEIKIPEGNDDTFPISPPLPELIIPDICPCTDEYIPVCASDDHTYANECILKCEQLKRTKLAFKYPGECIQPKVAPIQRFLH